MPSSEVAQIPDEELKGLMQQAPEELGAGDNLGSVKTCAKTYLTVLEKHPEVLAALRKVLEAETVKKSLEVGSIRFAPLMWPRLAAKLHLPEGEKPEITWDREYIGYGEASQYYEFTLNLILDAEKGQLQTKVGSSSF